MTETASMADVVFPALSWAEKDGTFTNMERRIQRLRKAVHREGMEDWRIVSEVSKNMSMKMDYSGAEEIFAEICRVSPLHRDLSYYDIAKGNVIYPYKGEPLRGATGDIMVRKSSQKNAAGKLYLRIERPLFHSGTLSRKAPALVNICPEATAGISPSVAASLLLIEGDIVRISAKAGSLELPVSINKALDNTTIMLSNNFEGKGAFSLVSYTIDSVTGAPCLDETQVTLEKVKA
jgi:predicted molibdopterin-dependent oxidoreductase YjgC